jgi:hypothetical protein
MFAGPPFFQERTQNQRLAISYGPEDARAALERSAAQTALNVRSRLPPLMLTPLVEQLILLLFGKTAKS